MVVKRKHFPQSPHPKPSTNTPLSQTGSAVRYTIVAILFFLLFAYFLGGYWHARHRVRKNLPPLAYHRWMVKRRSAHYPRYWGGGGVPMYASHPHHPHNNPYYMQQPQHPDYYGMQGSTHAPPPPAYHAGDAPPPVYQPPPQGGSKVAADQNYSEVGREDGEGGVVNRDMEGLVGRDSREKERKEGRGNIVNFPIFHSIRLGRSYA